MWGQGLSLKCTNEISQLQCQEVPLLPMSILHWYRAYCRQQTYIEHANLIQSKTSIDHKKNWLCLHCSHSKMHKYCKGMNSQAGMNSIRSHGLKFVFYLSQASPFLQPIPATGACSRTACGQQLFPQLSSAYPATVPSGYSVLPAALLPPTNNVWTSRTLYMLQEHISRLIYFKPPSATLVHG